MALTDADAKIREGWAPAEVLLVHWDGKHMSDLEGSQVEERLPVSVSGVGGHKVLGVPALPSKQADERVGPLIAEAVYSAVTQWGCEANVVGMVFDTCSANTGNDTPHVASFILVLRNISEFTYSSISFDYGFVRTIIQYLIQWIQY